MKVKFLKNRLRIYGLVRTTKRGTEQKIWSIPYNPILYFRGIMTAWAFSVVIKEKKRIGDNGKWVSDFSTNI